MSDFPAPEKDATPLKRALFAVRDLRAKVDALEARERARTESIAIIGIGCRFPGGVTDAESYWALLRDGVDAITEVPADRWDVDAFYDPTPGTLGKMQSRYGGFLNEVDRFDPNLFGISPREAAGMDPQQRLLLEVAWEALEDAGIAPDSLAGTAGGVFVGLCNNDYPRLLGDDAAIDLYIPTGTTFSVAAGRLSYVLGLQGPSLAIDTACSSSLVAVHLAVQSLRTGECDLALAGGVNLILAPGSTIAISQLRMLAPDGRCKTFDAAADGYVRGEGCGLVALKRLSDALTDGDRIHAVIRGSACNQDGRSGGLTAPNGLAQEAVIRRALTNANVEAASIGFVETHGTGTALGDPIEVQALAGALGASRSPEQPLRIGSVKTNLGHLEAAAGIASLLKAVLALKYGEVPPSLHFHTPSPYIPWGEVPVAVASRLTAWAAGEEPRRAGVSSFGFSGTNTHLILEAAPTVEPQPSPNCERPLHPLVLSAATEPALREQAARFAAHLAAHPEQSLADVAFTANNGRARFPHRLALAGMEASGVAEALAAYGRGETPAGMRAGVAPEGHAPKIAFLFPGQGAAWAGMGQELYEAQPAYRTALDRCAELLAPHLDRPLREILTSEELLADTTYAQPALFAVEWALAEMWRSFGVEPAAVLGHSVGEYVAATVAGVLSLEDALRLIAARGRLMGALPRNGAMAAVLGPVARVEPWVAQHATQVSIAAENAPEQTVISGERAAVEAILATLAQEGVRAQLLPVSHAFHSPLLEPMLAEFEQVAASVSYANPEIRLLSNRTGRSVQPGEINARYWVEHARGAVRFREGVTVLADLGVTSYLEVGPGATLTGLGRHCLGAKDGGDWFPGLRPRRELSGLAEAVGALFVAGAEVDWRGWDQDYPRQKLSLPTYPFQRQRYWLANPVIQRGKAAPRAEAPGEDWFYRVEWRDTDLTPQPPSLQGKGETTALVPPTVNGSLPSPRRRGAGGEAPTWLLISDQGGIAEPLANRLRERGETVTIAPPDAFAIPETEGELRVIHLAGLEAAEGDLEAAVTRGSGSVLQVLRSLASVRDARLWVVTRGKEGAAWGVGRVAALEAPERWGGLIGLEEGTSAESQADALLAELTSGDGEDQIACHSGQRRAARLVRYSVPPDRQVACAPEGSYLITGGLGALGLATARRLAARGARHLVLLGRRAGNRGGWSEAAKSAVSALEQAGVTVAAVSVDVSDREALGEILARFGREWPVLRGIFHAAGVAEPRELATVDEEAFREGMRAKAAGAWALHELSSGHTGLEWFVLYSSGAAVWGGRGLAVYASANASLDALAAHRRAAGQTALSVNWGPWQGAGMAADEEAARLLARQGLRGMPEEQALSALERLLAAGTKTPSSVVVADLDWPVFQALYEARGPRPLLADLRSEVTTARSGADTGELRRQLEALPEGERRQAVLETVCAEVARVLGFENTATEEPERGFFHMGMDSLTAVELKTNLERGLAAELPSTLAFDCPNAAALAAFLADEVLGFREPELPAAPDEWTLLADEVDTLSVDEMAELLARELAASQKSR